MRKILRGPTLGRPARPRRRAARGIDIVGSLAALCITMIAIGGAITLVTSMKDQNAREMAAIQQADDMIALATAAEAFAASANPNTLASVNTYTTTQLKALGLVATARSDVSPLGAVYQIAIITAPIISGGRRVMSTAAFETYPDSPSTRRRLNLHSDRAARAHRDRVARLIASRSNGMLGYIVDGPSALLRTPSSVAGAESTGLAQTSAYFGTNFDVDAAGLVLASLRLMPIPP